MVYKKNGTKVRTKTVCFNGELRNLNYCRNCVSKQMLALCKNCSQKLKTRRNREA